VSRASFESSQDRGLIGKSITRPFNLGWNYFCKGLIGSLFAVSAHVGAFALSSVASLSALLLAPAWSAACSVLQLLTSVLIFDVDAPQPRRQVLPLPRLLLRAVAKGLAPMVRKKERKKERKKTRRKEKHTSCMFTEADRFLLLWAPLEQLCFPFLPFFSSAFDGLVDLLGIC
jgi:hypothetical protein